MHSKILLFVFMLMAATSYAQMYPLRLVDTKTTASFRGLSVAGDHAIWVSGSKGWIGRSADGGKSWTFKQVPGYESCDFRTLYAFDSNNAIIANAGSPAYILRTVNGGTSWQQVYKNNDSAAFIDGIDFWNRKRGVIYGDPVNSRMLLLYTKDGGKTWRAHKQRKCPEMEQGEASFAASGTNIKCLPARTVVIAAGGKTSKLYISGNRGRRWRSIPTPMLATSESTGIFSFMPGKSKWHWLIAGGDYRRDSLKTANFFYSPYKGKQWIAPVTTTRGYRECLAVIEDEGSAKKNRTRTMFAAGPSGIDISADDGVNWRPLSEEKGFHVIKPSRDHNFMFLAGSNGKLAIMQIKP